LSWRQGLAIGAVASALPFWLVAWGEKHVDSGIAAIAQSTVPLFTILLGLRFLPHEPLTRAQLLGFALGLVGVGVLAGAHPEGGWWAVAGTLAVVLSSLAYSCGNVIGQRSVSGTPGPVLATGAMFAATVTLLPIAFVQAPTSVPDTDALLSLLALALLGTALAQLVLYRMLNLFGARSASLVTYLMPGFALVYGALLLDEPITVAALGGLALILAGVALGSGALRRWARGEPAEAVVR
jgi:drug/metabolite transporter (DMT)-like permease